MMMAFSVRPVHGLFSVEALCISWLIQETALTNSFVCHCHGTSGRICRCRVSQCGAYVIH